MEVLNNSLSLKIMLLNLDRQLFFMGDSTPKSRASGNTFLPSSFLGSMPQNHITQPFYGISIYMNRYRDQRYILLNSILTTTC